jgi:hypothetical protein
VIFSRKSAAIWPFASSIKIATTGVQGAGDGSKQPFIGPGIEAPERGLL